MASEKKRVDSGIAKLNELFDKTVRNLPEFVDNPAAIPGYLKSVVQEVAGIAVKANREGYQDVYIPGKDFYKRKVQELTARMSEETGLSQESVKQLALVLGGAAKLALEGEAKIPPQTVTFKGGDVTVGGYVNPKKDEYSATGEVNFNLDRFGLKEGYLTAGATASSTPKGVSIDRASLRTEVPLLGGKLSAGVGGNLDEQQATLGFKTTFKKGGKVKKKTKNKNYTKGCAVRTAKY